ncbi:MAG: hypothetical protein RL186_1353, partial [Pseudomonadota bacterium]
MPPKPLRRAIGTRSPKPKFTLFCEGKNTEPMYFQALIKALNGALIELVVIEGAGSPITLKDKAKELVRAQKIRRSKANSFEGNDQIWVVFDEDQ